METLSGFSSALDSGFALGFRHAGLCLRLGFRLGAGAGQGPPSGCFCARLRVLSTIGIESEQTGFAAAP